MKSEWQLTDKAIRGMWLGQGGYTDPQNWTAWPL